MTTRQDLQQALENQNVRAFLRVIREGESDQTGKAYRKMVGDPPGVYSILDLRKHPNRVIYLPNLGVQSSGAGAYQFLFRTWYELLDQYGFEDFNTACQDEGAVGLIVRRKSLAAIVAGDLNATLDKCSYEWASLPPGRYGQPTITFEKALQVYDKWGGKLEPV